jgi:hypothetical protein
VGISPPLADLAVAQAGEASFPVLAFLFTLVLALAFSLSLLFSLALTLAFGDGFRESGTRALRGSLPLALRHRLLTFGGLISRPLGLPGLYPRVVGEHARRVVLVVPALTAP